MKVAIVGSRDWSKEDLIRDQLDLMKKHYPTLTIVSGGARGVDTFAERWAKDNKVPTIIYLPDWERHGRSAGFRRNYTIIQEADMVVAFWDKKSKGTEHSINLGIKRGIPVFVFYPDLSMEKMN